MAKLTDQQTRQLTQLYAAHFMTQSAMVTTANEETLAHNLVSNADFRTLDSAAPVIRQVKSLQEKKRAGIAIKNAEWLSDKDLTDILQRLQLQGQIIIDQLDAQSLGQQLHFARRDHQGCQTPYSIPLLLNKGGNHWINAVININPTKNPAIIHVTVKDSLGISRAQEQYFTTMLRQAIHFHEESVEAGTRKTFSAFPRSTPTFSFPVKAATQKDGWSCGYRAMTDLLASQFKDHHYPAGTADLLDPLQQKTSAQLQTGIYTLLEVNNAVPKAMTKSKSAPALSHLDTSSHSPAPKRDAIDWLKTELLQEPVSQAINTGGNALAGLNIATLSVASTLEQNQTTLIKARDILNKQLETVPPCSEATATVERVNTLPARSSIELSLAEKDQIRASDLICALKWQLTEIEACLNPSRHGFH